MQFEVSRKWATLGRDVVIPNMDYLFENKGPHCGASWPNGHADAIGALPYLFAEGKSLYWDRIDHCWLNFFRKAMTVWRTTTFMLSIKNSEIDFGVMLSFLSFKQPTPSFWKYRDCDWHSWGQYRSHRDFKFDQTASESYATDFARLAWDWRKAKPALLTRPMRMVQVASGARSKDAASQIRLQTGMVVIVKGGSQQPFSDPAGTWCCGLETGRRVVLTGWSGTKNEPRLAVPSCHGRRMQPINTQILPDWTK